MEEYLEFAKDIAYQAGKIMDKYIIVTTLCDKENT